MPANKIATSHATAETNTAGGSGYASPWVDWRTRYDGVVEVVVTNGATGPTAGGTIQLQVSGDNGTNITTMGPAIPTAVGNSAVTTHVFHVKTPVMYWRVNFSAPTGQNQTITYVRSQVLSEYAGS